MVTIYIARHGQTDYNKAGLLQGQIDIPLNNTGFDQAYKLKVILKGVHFSSINSSDLSRAIETARIVAGQAPDSYKEFREKSFGKYEGLRVDKFLEIPENERTREVENFDDAAKRFNDKLVAICNEQELDSNVLLVSHSSIIKTFCQTVGIHYTKLGNCEYLIIKYDKDTGFHLL